MYDMGKYVSSMMEYKEKFERMRVGAQGISILGATWGWQEDESSIVNHHPSSIFCETLFVKYEPEVSKLLEMRYEDWQMRGIPQTFLSIQRHGHSVSTC